MRYAIIILSIFLFAACKKTTTEPDQRSLLVDKKWQTTSMRLRDQAGNIGAELWPSMTAAVKDDYIIYYNAGHYSVNDNAIRQQGYPTVIIDTGSWQLSNSIIYEQSQFHSPTSITITSIDANNMVFEASSSSGTYIISKTVLQ